jgi:hypothetical protein
LSQRRKCYRKDPKNVDPSALRKFDDEDLKDPFIRILLDNNSSFSQKNLVPQSYEAKKKLFLLLKDSEVTESRFKKQNDEIYQEELKVMNHFILKENEQFRVSSVFPLYHIFD